MELPQLQALLPDPEKLKSAIYAERRCMVKKEEIEKQYDPKCHDITDKTKRPDKLVTTEVNGTDNVSTVAVARLPIPIQKRIVRLAAAFLCGNPIKLEGTSDEPLEKDLIEILKKTWADNKLDYRSKQLAKMMMSETDCAEIWYMQLAEEGFWDGTPNAKPKVKGKLRMRMIGKSLGDDLYPVFDASGDMIAFARGYSIFVAGTKTECFDVYTATEFHYFIKGLTGWVPREVIAYDGSKKTIETNPVKKIPVIYYSQPHPEWYDVQEMIDRLEKLISNHADTNDYHASPTIKVKGTVTGFAKKGESGKIIELDGPDADANYMSWDKSPDSLKLELENLINLIYGLTDTPNISFEQMKGLGTFSGIALKMLFLGAHMKASDKEEIFGESIQRRINYLKAALAFINTDFSAAVNINIEPKFTYYLPKDDVEMINILTTATGGDKIMSQETAISLNPLVQDPEIELERIQGESNSAGALDILNNNPVPGTNPKNNAPIN
jgi:hypothetical protein